MPRTEPSLPVSMAPRQPRAGRRRPVPRQRVRIRLPIKHLARAGYAAAHRGLGLDHGARGSAASALPRLDIRGMVCGGTMPAGRRASTGHRAPDAAADAPCPTDAARSAWSERSLLRLPCRSRTRTAFRRGPVARMGSLIAGYALCPAAYAAARKRNPAVRNGGTPRGAFRRRPPNTRQSGNTVPGPHRVDGLPQRPCRTVRRNGNLPTASYGWRAPYTAGN